MRNIKFRVWDFSAQEYLLQKDNGEFEPTFYPSEKLRDYELTLGWAIFNSQDFLVQQYTGLNDSKNREIFEGDILLGETRNDPKFPEFKGTVEFHQPTASFIARDDRGFTRGLNSFLNVEIVGNIYD